MPGDQGSLNRTAWTQADAMRQWSEHTQPIMRAAGIVAVMGGAAMLLASCAAAHPGSGKTAEQRRYDITSCNNLARHPAETVFRNYSQPDELPPMTVEQCLAMLGYQVKGPDGTIVAPPRLLLTSNSQIASSTAKPPVPVTTPPTSAVATPVAGATFGLNNLGAIVGAYNDNRPKFMRLYSGQSFGFDGGFIGKEAMNDASSGYVAQFTTYRNLDGNSVSMWYSAPIWCAAINDEATIDRIDGWKPLGLTQVRVVGTIADAGGGGLRLIYCTMTKL
jgi:hypothetical protein